MTTDSSEIASASTAPTIFISHSAVDQALAQALISLLQASLTLTGGEDIRCTSSAGYGAKQGDVAAQLKNDIANCTVVIALFTPASIKSAWVWLECGAAWMVHPTKIVPIFATRALSKTVPLPIVAQNRVIGDDPKAKSTLWSFLNDIAQHNSLPLKSNGLFLDLVDKFFEELKKSGGPVVPIVEPLPSVDDFCQISQLSSELRRQRFAESREDKNSLFHTHLHVIENRQLGAVKKAVEDFFKPLLPANIHDVVLWSTLGSIELAVTFRAPPKIGSDLQKRLIDRIHASAALGLPSVTKLEDMLDYYHYELAHEYNWGNGQYVSGHRIHRPKSKGIDRNTHAFIRLRHREATFEERCENVEKLNTLFEMENAKTNNDFYVDVYGASKCFSVVIIEMHLPCGRQESIKLLSIALESQLASWNKETFIVYDMEPLAPRTHLA
jgi:hypothetical protein